MEHLPVELRQTVLQFLDLESLKSIRLTSKAWAVLGEEYLISDSFTTLPHRDDMSRLLSISQHHKFCFRIQNRKLTLCLDLFVTAKARDIFIAVSVGFPNVSLTETLPYH